MSSSYLCPPGPLWCLVYGHLLQGLWPKLDVFEEIRGSSDVHPRDVVFLPEYFKNKMGITQWGRESYHKLSHLQVFSMRRRWREKRIGPKPEKTFKGIKRNQSRLGRISLKEDIQMPDYRNCKNGRFENWGKIYEKPFFHSSGLFDPNCTWVSVPTEMVGYASLSVAFKPLLIKELTLNDFTAISKQDMIIPMMQQPEWALNLWEWEKYSAGLLKQV